MEDALYERNMIQFFRKKTIIFYFEAGDRRYIVTCLSQSQSKKKKSLHKWMTKYLVGAKRKAMDPDAAFPIRAFNGFFFQIIVPDSRL